MPSEAAYKSSAINNRIPVRIIMGRSIVLDLPRLVLGSSFLGSRNLILKNRKDEDEKEDEED
jgi:hypothetical protein